MERYICPFPTENFLCDLGRIYDFSAMVDERIVFPDEISSGVVFRIGHLICPENTRIMAKAFVQPFDWDEEDYMDYAASDIASNLSVLQSILEQRPGLGNLEEIAAMPVQTFFESVTKPLYQKRLRELIAERIAAGEFDEIGYELDIFGEKNIASIQKTFPDLADVLQRSHQGYLESESNQKLSPFDQDVQRSLPPGHTWVEKKGMGVYALHAPEIR